VPKAQREIRLSARPGRRRDPSFASEITRLQRGRVIAAAIEVVEADGYASLTVAKVTECARVSRRTFYELFRDREDCFLAAFEQTLGDARERLAGAYASQPDWRDGMRVAVLEALGMIDENPGLARLCVVEALAAGQRVLERRAGVLEELARAIDHSIPPARREDQVVASAVAGGIAATLHGYLVGASTSRAELPGTLMAMIVLPYLGRAAAHAELATPAPTRNAAAATAVREPSPLQEIKLRLTYRTIRVLIAIAAQPGSSNRQIARSAGIGDQGQISKLLRRLRELGLIENFGEGQARGRTNAWRLTKLGEDVQRATGGG
jgi:AcrR family transcriptional regulator/DNA-binding MarR family transcriptional regulator